MKHNIHLTYLIIFLINVQFILLTHNKHHSSKNLNRVKTKNVFFEAWAHYFHEEYSDNFKPKNFFENRDYFQQRIKMNDKNKSDNLGSIAIPDRSSFYIVLYKDILSFYSSRDNIERKIIENVLIKNIAIIPEDNFKLGGVKDLRKISNYFCLSIQTSKPNDNKTNLNEIWTVCFENENLKTKLLSLLIKFKVDNQRANDQFITSKSLKKDSNSQSSSSSNDDQAPTDGDVQDGKLVLLQDWSECTLKCGGGKSYQQWMCIPPKNGGEPCDTELIKSKDCNIQPCPLAQELAEAKADETQFKKPIIKIGPFSQRHNRYSVCVIKEGEGFRLEKDENSDDYNRIPSKILMNTNTISIFEDDTYSKLVYSFILDNTNLTVEKDFCTFSLKDNQNQIILRGFEQSCGSIQENKFVKSWDRDFNVFKNDCKKGRQNVLINEEDQKKIDSLAKKSNELLYASNQAEKAENLRESFAAGQQGVISNNVTDTKKTGLKAIDKETQIENMILQEEKEREALEIATIQDNINKEKEKADNLNKTIKEKEMDDVFIEQERDSEKEIVEAKKEAQEKIEGKRTDLKDKIAKLRKMAQMKKSQMMGQLKNSKTKLAKKVMNAMKEGSSVICNVGKVKDKQSVRDDYCNKAFAEDFFSNNECKNVDNFCYTCCEKEFGNLHLDKREDCYNECDGLKASSNNQNQQKTDEIKPLKIKWLWSNKKKK